MLHELLEVKLVGQDIDKFIEAVKARILELKRAGFDKAGDYQIDMLFGMILIRGVNIPAFQIYLDQALVKQKLEGDHVRFAQAETTIRDWSMLVQQSQKNLYGKEAADGLKGVSLNKTVAKPVANKRSKKKSEPLCTNCKGAH